MTFVLKSISGLESAIASLKFTRRTWTPEWDLTMREAVHAVFDRNGFIIPEAMTDENKHWKEVEQLLCKLGKYGAGVGNSMYDAGHETLLRFIDFEFIVIGLHRAAQDDLDAHAMRMNNRIVRASSRNGDSINSGDMSEWYLPRILRFEDILDAPVKMGEGTTTIANLLPENIEMKVGDTTYKMIKTQHGFIREDCVDNGDAQRGLYTLAMASNCIFKVSFHDMRHIYMRRNEFTHASPELAEGVEMAADQIEAKLPILGDLIRNDYCDDGQLHHIMNICKHFVDVPKVSSRENPNAAAFG